MAFMDMMNPLMGNLDPQQKRALQQRLMLTTGLGMLRGAGQGLSTGEGIGAAGLSGMQDMDRMVGAALGAQMDKLQAERTKALTEATRAGIKATEARTEKTQQTMEEAQRLREARENLAGQLPQGQLPGFIGQALQAGMPGSAEAAMRFLAPAQLEQLEGGGAAIRSPLGGVQRYYAPRRPAFPGMPGFGMGQEPQQPEQKEPEQPPPATASEALERQAQEEASERAITRAKVEQTNLNERIERLGTGPFRWPWEERDITEEMSKEEARKLASDLDNPQQFQQLTAGNRALAAQLRRQIREAFGF